MPSRVKPVSKMAGQRIIRKEAIPFIREIDLRQLGISDYGTNQISGFRRPYANAAMELFINGRPYHLARYPDTGGIAIKSEDVLDKGLTGNEFHPGKIRFDKEKLAAWIKAKNMMVSGNFNFAWATDQLRVKDIDTATGAVSFADAHMYGISGDKEWNRYYFFNLMEEIDHPGEYFIDHEEGKLYFYPFEPVLASDTIVVSMLENALVTMKGTGHIQFRNIGFEAGRGMGIYMENTVSNKIEHCDIRDMGVVAVCIGKGSKAAETYLHPDPAAPGYPNEKQSERIGSLYELLYENTVFNREGGHDNGVVGCRIENTGCGGISLGGGDRLTLVPGGNYVYNCEFTNCGRIDYSYKSPINIDGVGNKVQHCQFDPCPATAIYMHGNDHLIEYNVFNGACDFMDDQGAIYMGRDPSEFGNIIRYNFFEHIGHFGMTMAVYYDDGACGSELYGNVFYKAGSRTIMVGGGSYNPIFNNIFIDSKMAIHLDNRLVNWAKSSLAPGGLFDLRLRSVNYRNPPYSKEYPGLADYFGNHPEIPQHNGIRNNVFVHVEQLHNGKKEWGPVDDENLVTEEDPGFVNAAGLDFNLKADAIVFKKLPGFKAVPFSEMGLIK
jgi:hypothetical protein